MGDVMQNPVIASDGRTYELVSIKEWIEVCKTTGLPVTSPLTRAPLTEVFKEDVKIKALILDAKVAKLNRDLEKGIHVYTCIFNRKKNLVDKYYKKKIYIYIYNRKKY